MIRTGKKFSKPEMSRVINGDKILAEEVEKPEKIRLDVLLGEYYSSYNRASLQKFIEFGFVMVDGEVAKKPSQKVERTSKIDLKIPTTMKNADLVPEVIYEDGNVMVLNKPAGLLSVARGQYCPENTLERYGLSVHRLDRDTSGVVMVAKSPEVQMFLKNQFKNRTTHKTYYAIVSGKPKLDEAKIDLPIARDLKRPTTFRVDPNGKASVTYFKVLKSDGVHSLVELKPVTGRTHQLRVHMKYIGHPILGDRLYGKEKAARLYLHAHKLSVVLPGGERKVFEAKLPEEFEDVFRKD